MIALIVIGLLIAASSGAPSKRQFGICAEMCSMSGGLLLSQCPLGFVCASNGCGHTCKPLKIRKAVSKDCPPVFCRMYCANGWAIGPDGCPFCACNTETVG